MTDNLFTPAGNSADPRPHQTGEARGFKWGSRVTLKTEWLIDTGAQISVVTKSKGASFDLTSVGGSASGTTGGGGILVNSGIDMIFKIFDSSGSPMQVTCSLDIGVKPNDDGSEILGMDQIKHVGAAVEWDPAAGTGRLKTP